MFDEALAGTDGMRALPSDRAGELHGIGEGVLAHMGGKTDANGLLAVDFTPGPDEFFGHVGADQAREEMGDGHIGADAPADLEDGHANVRGDEADVAAGGELDTGTEGDAVHGGDDGHRQLTPAPHRLLGVVGDAVVLHLTDAAGVALATARHRLEPRKVEACAPGRAIAGKHNGPQPLGLRQFVGGLDQRLEHRPVHGVHFVAAVEADVSDAVADLDGDAFRHSMLHAAGGRRLGPEHAGRHAADRRAQSTILHDTRLGANSTAGASLPQPASADAQLGASASSAASSGAPWPVAGSNGWMQTWVAPASACS